MMDTQYQFTELLATATQFPTRLRPHKQVTVLTDAGHELTVTPCMVYRLTEDDLDDENRVPNTMPQFNEPIGAACHAEWRDGCPVCGED